MSVSLGLDRDGLALGAVRLGGPRPRAAGAVDGAFGLRAARVRRAFVQVTGERGFAGASVGLVVASAGVSRRTFYELYGGLEGCFVAVLDDGYERVRALVREALERNGPWRDGLREALALLLLLLDEQPLLAKVWLVESLSAGPRILAHRERRMAQLREEIVATSPLPPGHARPPLAAEGTFASVLGIVDDHLLAHREGALLDMLGPLMGLVVAPYLGLEQAQQEIELGEQLARKLQAQRAAAGNGHGGRGAGEEEEALSRMLVNPTAHRARSCVLYLAAHPGASNRQVAAGIGINGKEQTSRLLSRLSAEGLVVKSTQGKGSANAWRLTPRGRRAVAGLSG